MSSQMTERCYNFGCKNKESRSCILEEKSRRIRMSYNGISLQIFDLKTLRNAYDRSLKRGLGQ